MKGNKKRLIIFGIIAILVLMVAIAISFFQVKNRLYY